MEKDKTHAGTRADPGTEEVDPAAESPRAGGLPFDEYEDEIPNEETKAAFAEYAEMKSNPGEVQKIRYLRGVGERGDRVTGGRPSTFPAVDDRPSFAARLRRLTSIRKNYIGKILTFAANSDNIIDESTRHASLFAAMRRQRTRSSHFFWRIYA